MGKDADCCDACKMFAGDAPVSVDQPTAPLAAERAGIVIAWTDRDGVERSIVPTGAVIRVGRSKDNDIFIPDGALSRHQCQLRFVGGELVVEDLRSTCGTYLDGRRVDRAVVRDGSVIYFGDSRLRITGTRSR